jgi:mannose-6-phosphate isomerase-like protein (cupin superfamily)
MKGYIVNIDQETRSNEDYRRVLYTAKNSQLVVMSIEPGNEIGEEIHELDQFIRLEEGSGVAVLGDELYPVAMDDALVIPAGLKHNITNTGDSPLKLYSVYSPPEHKDQLVQPTKADETEEHFDGITTEATESDNSAD